MKSRVLLLAAAAALACSSLGGQAPDAPWRTIETRHFRIHFPEPFEPWARRSAEAIESIHERVTGVVGYLPVRPIEVVVGDPLAVANGMALPFLDRPAIVLWTSPPPPESSIGFWDDWMEDLVVHEVAHVVHLARPRNRSRGILARLSPLPVGPLLLQSPRWLIEGYATVVEGALTGSGRPASSYRAMILRRFAIEGKLPGYGALSGTSGWLGASMAYLVGSTFLEWLEAKEGPGSLTKLWRRMASRRGGGFGAAFRAVFGRSPADLYDRFRAELTAAAIEEEKRLAAAGLVEGELWQRLDGGTLGLAISADGGKLVARRDPSRDESYLAVWTVTETDSERRAEEKRLAREAERLKDPGEVADLPETPRRRQPAWKLARVNGLPAESPRWMPDGQRVLFSRRVPDATAALRRDLWLWSPEAGSVRRVTREADVFDPDPSPDGSWAVAVRTRYGVSGLVKVDLATGEVRELRADAGPDDVWRVWAHPRVSPDGREIAALTHGGGRFAPGARRPAWRLVVVPASGGRVRELEVAGSPAGAPAWSPDGSRIFVASDREGAWNVEAVDARGRAPSELLTRVTGGALAPAPSPDGGSLYFLELTAKGVNVRRLPMPAPPVEPAGRRPQAFPLQPPDAASAAPFPRSPVGDDRPYTPWRSHAVRPLATYSIGPDGKSWQLGVEGTDVVGRLDWVAAVALGDSAGPRGGSLAVAWRGLPVAVGAHAFLARERPGRQRVVRRADLDVERLGGWLEASWSRVLSGGRLRIDAGGGAARMEALETDERFTRALGSLRARYGFRRITGKTGFGFEIESAGSAGTTDGRSWSQLLGGAAASAFLPVARISLLGRYGDTSGSPTRFDRFGIGGASSSTLPAGLDRNRVELAALPAFAQTGERVESVRGEIGLADLPIVVYGERIRAWTPSAGGKPDPVRVFGAELRIDERILAGLVQGDLAFYAGVAKIRSDAPRFDSTRGYAGLLYRP